MLFDPHILSEIPCLTSFLIPVNCLVFLLSKEASVEKIVMVSAKMCEIPIIIGATKTSGNNMRHIRYSIVAANFTGLALKILFETTERQVGEEITWAEILLRHFY